MGDNGTPATPTVDDDGDDERVVDDENTDVDDVPAAEVVRRDGDESSLDCDEEVDNEAEGVGGTLRIKLFP